MKLLAVLAVSATLMVAPAGAAELRISAVRHWSLSTATRVAVEVSGEFTIRTDRLHNPERVYYDIVNAKLRIDSHRFYTEKIEDPRVSRIRMAETPTGTRLVLDLAGPMECTASQLGSPNRLILEVRPAEVSPTRTRAPRQTAPDSGPSVPAESSAAKPAPAEAAQPSAVAKPPKDEARPEPKPEPLVVATREPAPSKTEPKPEAAAKPLTASEAPHAPAPPSIPKPAVRTSSGDQSLIRALGLKINRVVIDPGHGGHDQGTEGVKGLLEKDLVLDVAKRVGALIESRMGAEVIYTRDDDTFIPLEGRTAIANAHHADLFLSIHANSSPVGRTAGTEAFYLNFSGSKDAMDVAARENASSQKSVFELADLIQKITRHDKAEESREFADRLQTSLYSLSSRNFPGVKNRGVKRAPFVVLIGATMPSVLAEIGFLSNPKEEALLRKPDYRQKLADSLYRGIARYASSLSHFQVASSKSTATAAPSHASE